MTLTSTPRWAHRLPLPLHQAALAGMFVVEVLLPFAVFVAGWPRLLAAAGFIGLQLGIQLTGNFGYFNVLTAVLCVPLFDTADSLTLHPLAPPWGPAGPMPALGAALAAFVGLGPAPPGPVKRP